MNTYFFNVRTEHRSEGFRLFVKEESNTKLKEKTGSLILLLINNHGNITSSIVLVDTYAAKHNELISIMICFVK